MYWEGTNEDIVNLKVKKEKRNADLPVSFKKMHRGVGIEPSVQMPASQTRVPGFHS